MKTYLFKVVVEPDEDRRSAYCPALLQAEQRAGVHNKILVKRGKRS